MVNLFIEGQLIDQYKDENVEIMSSVLDVYDITKNTGDYSNAFTVPTSKRNNKIFKHWYNASIDGGFDARTRVSGSIDIDGVPFKTGKWLLRGVKMIKGVADSYSINFFGETASLSEIAGDDTLNDLRFDSLNHAYDAATVTAGLTVGLFNNSIIYTPIAQKDFFYDNSLAPNDVGDFPTGATSADDTPDITSYNIAYNSSSKGTGLEWTDLRPSVRALDIVEAIERKYNGVYQESVISIIKEGTSNGNAILTLNGEEHLIYLRSAMNKAGVAFAIKEYINLSITGYTATSSTVFVTVTSETYGREITTSIVPNTYIGLTAGVKTTLGSANKGLSFTRDFFGTTEFERLYMWLNAEIAPVAIGNSATLVDWTTGNIYTDTTTNTTALKNIDGDNDCKWTIDIQVTPTDLSIPYSIRMIDQEQEDNDGTINQSPLVSGTHSLFHTLEMNDYRSYVPLGGGAWFASTEDTAFIDFEVVTSQSISFIAELTIKYIDNSGAETFSSTALASSQTVFAGVEVNKLLPDMKISEFLKSMMQMFKLVLIGEGDNKYYINTLDSFYAQGDRFDMTKYIDRSKYDVDRGEIISELKFNFEEPTTKGALKFLENNGVAYGDSEVRLTTPEGDALDGDTVDVKLPYENVVYNRLSNYTTLANTDIQVGTMLDLDGKAVLSEPLLHYATLIDISNSNSHIKFKGVTSSQRLDTDMWMPFSHFGVNEPVYSLLFESEISTYTYSKIKNTLYSRHYQDYITAIYNIKRRTIKHEAKLPIQMITRLSLNDIITIDGLDYRMNKYSYNLLTGITKLELINGFAKYNVTDLYIPEGITIGLNAETLYFNVPNISDYTITPVAQGSGTAFVTVSVEGTENNLVKIVVDEWSPTAPTGTPPSSGNPFRYVKIRYVNSSRGGATTEMLITQTPNNVL
jgi:hypothetical protein